MSDDDEFPDLTMFANAVQVWAWMQPRAIASVAQAAAAFNVEPARIIEAINSHCWMYLSGPTDDYAKLMIEHEGE